VSKGSIRLEDSQAGNLPVTHFQVTLGKVSEVQSAKGSQK